MGEIIIKTDSLKTGQLAMTKKFCTSIPENEFINFIETTNNYEVKSNLLNFKSDDKIVLTFSKTNE